MTNSGVSSRVVSADCGRPIVLSTNTDIHINNVKHNTMLIISHIQGVSRLQSITAGGDFLGFCDQKKFI